MEALGKAATTGAGLILKRVQVARKFTGSTLATWPVCNYLEDLEGNQPPPPWQQRQNFE